MAIKRNKRKTAPERKASGAMTKDDHIYIFKLNKEYPAEIVRPLWDDTPQSDPNWDRETFAIWASKPGRRLRASWWTEKQASTLGGVYEFLKLSRNHEFAYIDKDEYASTADIGCKGEYWIAIDCGVKTTVGETTTYSPAEATKVEPDPINPSHYKDQYPIEVQHMIKLIMDECAPMLTGFGAYCLGNELKYRLRAGFKDPSTIEQDIKKAMWYNARRKELESKGSS